MYKFQKVLDYGLITNLWNILVIITPGDDLIKFDTENDENARFFNEYKELYRSNLDDIFSGQIGSLIKGRMVFEKVSILSMIAYRGYTKLLDYKIAQLQSTHRSINEIINKRNEHNRTALHHALCDSNHIIPNMVTKIIALGADLEIVDAFGISPLGIMKLSSLYKNDLSTLDEIRKYSQMARNMEMFDTPLLVHDILKSILLYFTFDDISKICNLSNQISNISFIADENNGFWKDYFVKKSFGGRYFPVGDIVGDDAVGSDPLRTIRVQCKELLNGSSDLQTRVKYRSVHMMNEYFKNNYPSCDGELIEKVPECLDNVVSKDLMSLKLPKMIKTDDSISLVNQAIYDNYKDMMTILISLGCNNYLNFLTTSLECGNDDMFQWIISTYPVPVEDLEDAALETFPNENMDMLELLITKGVGNHIDLFKCSIEHKNMQIIEHLFPYIEDIDYYEKDSMIKEILSNLNDCEDLDIIEILIPIVPNSDYWLNLFIVNDFLNGIVLLINEYSACIKSIHLRILYEYSQYSYNVDLFNIINDNLER